MVIYCKKCGGENVIDLRMVHDHGKPQVYDLEEKPGPGPVKGSGVGFFSGFFDNVFKRS
jgi:hypothetical protein